MKTGTNGPANALAVAIRFFLRAPKFFQKKCLNGKSWSLKNLLNRNLDNLISLCFLVTDNITQVQKFHIEQSNICVDTSSLKHVIKLNALKIKTESVC